MATSEARINLSKASNTATWESNLPIVRPFSLSRMGCINWAVVRDPFMIRSASPSLTNSTALEEASSPFSLIKIPLAIPFFSALLTASFASSSWLAARASLKGPLLLASLIISLKLLIKSLRDRQELP